MSAHARSGECSRHFGARSERIRAIGGLVDVIGSREIAAGAEPAHRNGKAATSTGGLAHDVSILIGVGRQLGSQPRANTSMTIMRAPQRGHGQGSTRGRNIRLLLGIGGRWGDIEECAGRRDALGAIGGGKEPVVAVIDPDAGLRRDPMPRWRDLVVSRRWRVFRKAGCFSLDRR
jgi:hypothetical protein